LRIRRRERGEKILYSNSDDKRRLSSVQDFFQARNKLIGFFFLCYPVSLTRIGRSNNINEHIFKLCWTKRGVIIRIDVDGMRRICMKNKEQETIHTHNNNKIV
jgi:hypothetical protein